jgi:hypothetical protein
MAKRRFIAKQNRPIFPLFKPQMINRPFETNKANPRQFSQKNQGIETYSHPNQSATVA